MNRTVQLRGSPLQALPWHGLCGQAQAWSRARVKEQKQTVARHRAGWETPAGGRHPLLLPGSPTRAGLEGHGMAGSTRLHGKTWTGELTGRLASSLAPTENTHPRWSWMDNRTCS